MGAAKKRRTETGWDHDRGAYSVDTDYMGPKPIFNDKMFERTFRITRTMAQEILTHLANANKFYRNTTDTLGRPSICPKVKLLMALKMLAYSMSSCEFVDISRWEC